MTSRALLPGTKLQGEKYRIERELGNGGFGITYLAENTMLNGKVAIKEFFFSDYCNRNEQNRHVTIAATGSIEMVEKFKRKFLKEAQSVFNLKHPNIISILDVFEENDTAYIVMEYAPGGSLREKLVKEVFLPEPVATRYILQIADALSHIHSQKINHLDVKPGNIVLNEKGEAVLIDFGLSKQYDEDKNSMTTSTPVGVTEGYTPVEQYHQGGVQNFSPETDVYALGATFYKLLTGQTPPSASEVFDQGLPLDPLKEKGISEKAVNVILKAMQLKKTDRFRSTEKFREALLTGIIDDDDDKDDNDENDEVDNGEVEVVSVITDGSQDAGDARRDIGVKDKTKVKPGKNQNVITPHPHVDPPSGGNKTPVDPDKPKNGWLKYLFGFLVLALLAGLGGYFFKEATTDNDNSVIDITIDDEKRSVEESIEGTWKADWETINDIIESSDGVIANADVKFKFEGDAMHLIMDATSTEEEGITMKFLIDMDFYCTYEDDAIECEYNSCKVQFTDVYLSYAAQQEMEEEGLTKSDILELLDEEVAPEIKKEMQKNMSSDLEKLKIKNLDGKKMTLKSDDTTFSLTKI